ncbi:MAG: tryptophan synthase subunit alpha [Candidatus Geothermarchaeales archaeon]
MRLEPSFQKASSEGKLVLLPEIIVGFPSMERSVRALDYLADLNHLIYKTATPVASGWPMNTNDAIRRAHASALSNGVDLTRTVETIARYRPNVLTIYSDAITDPFRAFLDRLEGYVDGIILAEGNEPEDRAILKTGLSYSKCRELCRDRGIDFVPAVSTWNRPEVIREKVLSAKGFVYLMISTGTGGTIFGGARIQGMLDRISELRKVPVAVAFGVRGPQEIRMVHGLRGCGGAVIGTRIIETLSQSLTSYTELIDSIATYASSDRADISRSARSNA